MILSCQVASKLEKSGKAEIFSRSGSCQKIMKIVEKQKSKNHEVREKSWNFVHLWCWQPWVGNLRAQPSLVQMNHRHYG